MPLKVLVVDDSRTARKILRKSFPAGWDIEVVEAEGGKQALEMCSSSKFDLMFLDLTMPEVDGFQVLEGLKGMVQKPLVIVVSADIQPKAVARVLLLGAFDFVQKPADPVKLAQVLQLAGMR